MGRHPINPIDPVFAAPATPMTIDFRVVRDVYLARDNKGLMRNVNRKGYRMDMIGTITTESIDFAMPMGTQPGIGLSNGISQKRARLRRRAKAGMKIADKAFNDLYKPVEEWDWEELARGRPRDIRGKFGGHAPTYITPEIHERAMKRFQQLVKVGMNRQTINAMDVVEWVLTSQDEDSKGKPVVGASTKMEAAKFLIEHVVGKAVQPTTADISVKLQGILAGVMVAPDQVPTSYNVAHMGSRGELESGEIIDVDVVDEDDYDGEETR